MKRGKLILVFAISLILILSLSVVSAGWWSKLTGNPIFNFKKANASTTGDNEGSNIYETSSCLGNICTLYEGESLTIDNKNVTVNYIGSSEVKLNWGKEDTTVLSEGDSYLLLDKSTRVSIIDIRYDPKDTGRSSVIFSYVYTINETKNTTTCTDTDTVGNNQGVNYYKKGKVVNYIDKTYWTDECQSDKKHLQEGSCNPELGIHVYECPAGCKNGACNPEDTTTSETQTQSGFGAWLSNLFNNKNNNAQGNSPVNDQNQENTNNENSGTSGGASQSAGGSGGAECSKDSEEECVGLQVGDKVLIYDEYQNLKRLTVSCNCVAEMTQMMGKAKFGSDGKRTCTCPLNDKDAIKQN